MEGVANMLIQINYPDNRFDYVKDKILDTLIEAKRIRRFRRSTGWVTLGVDPTRKTRREYTKKMISDKQGSTKAS